MNQVRLTYKELSALKTVFHKHFLSADRLWLFGSRANIAKKGGDIDLYVETNASTIEEAIKMKAKFIWDLEVEIGEQKIDVVLNILNFPHELLIHKVAKEEGVRII